MAAPATYRDERGRVEADACRPLAEAVDRGELVMSALARGAYPGRRLPANALPGVRSVGYWDAERDQTWGLDWHRNEGVEFVYVSSGRVPFATRAGTVTLRPGFLAITRPWQEHRLGAPHVTAGRLHWLILDVGVRRAGQAWRWPDWLIPGRTGARRLARLLQAGDRPVWRVDAATASAFERLTAAVDRAPRDRSRWIALFANELLLALAETLARPAGSSPGLVPDRERRVEDFLAQLPDRLAEPWTLDRLAAECGLGRTRFAHHCARLTNRSPVEYLTWCRLQRAAELLRARPPASITDVAFECGFGSSQYFATVFRRHLGCSPRQYAQATERLEGSSTSSGLLAGPSRRTHATGP